MDKKSAQYRNQIKHTTCGVCTKLITVNRFDRKHPVCDNCKPKRICETCHKEFCSIVQIGNKTIRLSDNRKHCLNCLPQNTHYRKQFSLEGKEMKCQKCGGTFIHHTSKSTYHHTKICNKCYQRMYRDKLKNIIKERKLPGCCICGYKKCVDAIVFHHSDSKTKNFSISHRGGTSISRTEAEIDKCILLCANCHLEVHAGITKLP